MYVCMYVYIDKGAFGVKNPCTKKKIQQEGSQFYRLGGRNMFFYNVYYNLIDTTHAHSD